MQTKMRTCLTILLAAVLCAERAHSLKCYTCIAQASNDQCMIPTDCTDADKYCAAVIGTDKSSSSGAMRITKLCPPMCTAASQHAGLGNVLPSAATGTIATVAGRLAGVRISYATLGVGIWAVFCLLVWTGRRHVGKSGVCLEEPALAPLALALVCNLAIALPTTVLFPAAALVCSRPCSWG